MPEPPAGVATVPNDTSAADAVAAYRVLCGSEGETSLSLADAKLLGEAAEDAAEEAVAAARGPPRARETPGRGDEGGDGAAGSGRGGRIADSSMSRLARSPKRRPKTSKAKGSRMEIK